MDWRLNKITITNFKFFCDEFILPVDCKNILIYGENGSGKSSLYWSLYTILQSCLKPDCKTASKYFDANNSENLRNRFSDTAYSGIQIEFKHNDGRTKSFENSSEVTNTQTSDDNFMRLTAAASGFMNYKFLSALFEFKNSEQNNVFPIFEKEIFPFLEFSRPFDLIPGDNFPSTTTAEGWWRYIQRCHNDPNILPHSPSKKSSVLENTHQYKQFRLLIQDFNTELMKSLREITHRVNEKLVKIFCLPISLSYNLIKADFNKIKPGTTKAKDGIIHCPQIILTAHLNHKVIKDTRAIYHPKSFFNEAKLTVVALAMRLSIYEMMISNTPDCAEMLIIDDLLISLDMCNRIKIIDVLLEYENRGKQIVIMTHDRGLYNLIKSKIDAKESWKSLELYSKYEGYNNDEIPVPVIVNYNNYIEQAHRHIKSFDFPAAANSLRKACESILKRLLPENWLFVTGDDGTHQFLSLHGMISAGAKLNDFYQISLPFDNLDSYRERILNPFSHDDIRTPLYRGELMLLLRDIENLSQVKKKNITNPSAVGKDSYHFEVSNEVGTLKADFIFMEHFSIIKSEGNTYFSNSEIKVINCDLRSWHNKSGKIRRFLRDLALRVNIAPEDAYDYVLDPRTGKSLKDLGDSI